MPDITNEEWEALLPEATVLAHARVLYDTPHLARGVVAVDAALVKIRAEVNMHRAQAAFNAALAGRAG